MARRDLTCRDCGHPVAFPTLLPSGKKIPIDVSPDPEVGTLRRSFHSDGKKRTSTVVELRGPELDQARATGERLWIKHFVTCPGRRPASRPTTPSEEN